MKVAVLLARGAEEIEVVVPVDVLRRAGVEVVLVGIAGPEPVLGSRAITLTPDVGWDELEGPFDAIVVPGGAGGVEGLKDHAGVGTFLRSQVREGVLIGAICAGPSVLAAHGVLGGMAMTSHPSVRALVAAHGRWVDGVVVEDKNLITSPGAGASFPFALALVRRLKGEEVEETVRKGMVYS